MARPSSSQRKQRVAIVAVVGFGVVILFGLVAGWDSPATAVSLAFYLVGMWIAVRRDVAEDPGEAESEDSFDADEFDDC